MGAMDTADTPAAQPPRTAPVSDRHLRGFDDLLAANRAFAETFALRGFDGIAHAGVAVVTCMDSRIDPLGMLGLKPGDAKIFRNPGGRVTANALEALVLGVHLLGVDRILIVPHTRCAMASNTEDELRGGGRVRRSGRLVAGLPRHRRPAGGAAPTWPSARTRSSPTASPSAASSTTSTPGCSSPSDEGLAAGP